MSAQSFQAVMAGLIRYPTYTLEKIRESLPPVSLSEKEERQLRQMAVDPLVRKFGYKMSLCRRRDATEVMKLSKDFIDPEILDEMFYKRFEPTRTSTDLVMLGVQFLEFALSDTDCLKLLESCPPFTRDLMLYDLAKASVLRMVNKATDSPLPPDSLLASRLFQIIKIECDAPAIDQLKTKDPNSKQIPSLKPLTLIFMRVASPPYYRMFQIDDSIAEFLMIQKENALGWKGELPKPFAAMVKVGLCRNPEETV